MCTNYTPTARDRLQAARLGVVYLPPEAWPPETYPGYVAPILVRMANTSNAVQCMLAQFGLSPRWSRDTRHALEMSRHTTNARSETVADKPSFRAPWREQQRALVPMDNFFEPCWETGQAVRWRIACADAQPFTVAGLWERWHEVSQDRVVTSFTLLTVNADAHPLMRRMHKPGDEKRMPAIITTERQLDWLHAANDEAMALLLPLDAAAMVAEPAPRPRVARTTKATAPGGTLPESRNLSLF